MKPPLKKPCRECPMRRDSMPGWTGAATPKDLIDAMASGYAMPCHLSVDYEDPDWEDGLDGEAIQCVGQAIFLKNICKLPRPGQDAIVAHSSDRENIFANQLVLLEHHED